MFTPQYPYMDPKNSIEGCFPWHFLPGAPALQGKDIYIYTLYMYIYICTLCIYIYTHTHMPSIMKAGRGTLHTLYLFNM